MFAISAILAAVSYTFLGAGIVAGGFSVLSAMLAWYVLTVRHKVLRGEAWKRKNAAMVSDSIAEMESAANEFGRLGMYAVDTGSNFGLFTRIGGDVVFVDIGSKSVADERTRYAMEIYENSGVLMERFSEFLRSARANQEWSGDTMRIVTVGLYDKKAPRRAEVFLVADECDDRWWCVLEDLQFSHLAHNA